MVILSSRSVYAMAHGTMPLEHKSSPLDDDRMNIMMMINDLSSNYLQQQQHNTNTHVRTVFPVIAFAGKEPIRECCKGAAWFGGGEA